MRYYSIAFRVGGRVSGFDCHVEVKAKNKRHANLLIRARIRKLPDVEGMPEFHWTEIVTGKPVVESDGHDAKGYCKQTRPTKLVDRVKAENDADAIRDYLIRIGEYA